jgi:putative ABC transport system ATP-binding protein
MTNGAGSDYCIEAEDLQKCYRVGEVAFPALNGVSLRVPHGELAVLAGRSGSGKTTLLNVIGGLELPDRGRVLLCGQDFLGRSRDARAVFRLHHVGFVFQAYNLVRVLTALENVAFPCQLQGNPRARCLEIAERWLVEVGLGDRLDRRPDQLSGGQQQRVAVARALATGPDIVLADEPTANLDTATGRDLIALIKHLNGEFGTTFLISSHDPAVIESASLLVQLRDGRVVQAGDEGPPALPEAPVTCPDLDKDLRHRLLRTLWRRADRGRGR